jgi:hypothetical protein
MGSFWFLYMPLVISSRRLHALNRLRTSASKQFVKKQNTVLEKNCAKRRELTIGTLTAWFRTSVLT